MKISSEEKAASRIKIPSIRTGIQKLMHALTYGASFFELPQRFMVLTLIACQNMPGVATMKSLAGYTAYLTTKENVKLALTVHDIDAPTIGEAFYRTALAAQRGEICNLTASVAASEYTQIASYHFKDALGQMVEAAELAANNVTSAMHSAEVQCLKTVLEGINHEDVVTRDFFEIAMMLVGLGMAVTLGILGCSIWQRCKPTSNNQQDDIEMEPPGNAIIRYQSGLTF